MKKKATYKLQWDGEQKFRFDNGCNSTVYKVDTKMTNLNKCDLNKDNTVDISDMVRYNNKCRAHESNSPTSCDLNGDRKFDVSDDITFNDKCLNGEIAGYNKQKITSNFGTISIANPDNPSEGFTIMDRNLGATEIGAGKEASYNSYGNCYQRGNNYGFPCKGEITNITNERVDASGYGPNNPYSNPKFIDDDFYRDETNNHNLWGGKDDKENKGLYPIKNLVDRQGPCPEGYHVPSAGEWSKILEFWCNSNPKKCNLESTEGLNYTNVEYDIGLSFANDLKIPFAGYRWTTNATSFEGRSITLRTSSPSDGTYEGYSNCLKLTEGINDMSITTLQHMYRSKALPIRCFKNTYEPTVTVETNKKSPDLGTLVYIKKQINLGFTTQYTIGIEKDDENMPVYNVSLFSSSDCAGTSLNTESQKSIGEGGREYSDGEVIEAINSEYVQAINSISYTYNEGKYVCISKKDYPDYFKVNGDSRKVYKYSTQNKTNNQNNGYSEEMNNAYEFAYDNGITTINTIDRARMNGTLTRIEMAKMLSNYAINVLGKTPDTSKQCNFLDISNSLDAKYDYGVTKACQLGIMGQNVRNNKFRPYDTITRAQFVSALSRMMYGINDGSGKVKYYEPHMSKLYNEGIISKKDPKMEEKRGNVMLMVYRASE